VRVYALGKPPGDPVLAHPPAGERRAEGPQEPDRLARLLLGEVDLRQVEADQRELLAEPRLLEVVPGAAADGVCDGTVDSRCSIRLRSWRGGVRIDPGLAQSVGRGSWTFQAFA
jgi:hypothetical protein